MATRARDPGMAASGPSPGSVRVRPMTRSDLPRVMEIERAAFTVPWTATTFRGLLDRRDAHLRVAELEGEVVGYAAVWIVLDQAELGDIAVAADRRGQGIGALLLRTMMDVCREQGVRDLFLEVRVSNVGARRLYERHGFRMIGRRARYYSKPKEDALVLRTRLTS